MSLPAHPVTPAAARAAVCAVVVTYRPGPDVPGNLAAIGGQVERLIIVDNESSAASRERLAPLLADPRVEYIANPENLGIATALNQGVARATGFAWVATFDQDSLVPAGYFTGLLLGFDRYARREKVAVLAPLYRDRHLGFVFSPGGPVPAGGPVVAPVSVTATSGNLVASAALREIGGFREDLFIDCVDFEFCLRCRRAGWQVLEVRDVTLEHAAGRWQQRRWLWKNPRFNDYDAVRRYYQARNRLILYARLGLVDPGWTLHDAWGYGCDGVKLLLFCDRRREKLRAMLTGAWHALTGRRGRWQRGSPDHSMADHTPVTVLHYTGYDDDRGGIMTVIHNLAAVGRFRCVLGVNPECRQRREPRLEQVEFPRIASEKISPQSFWRARAVARTVREWLHGAPGRIYHGHSRAGLLVALWLHRWGERRVVVSVHCYGRQRWFYRWAARQLAARLFWLSPAMKKHYRTGDDSWAQCIPGGVPSSAISPSPGTPGRLRLGGIGALVRWKGWHTVIQALALLPPGERTCVTFAHIGAGETDYRAELEGLAASSGLSGQVTFGGEEVSSVRLLGQIDALVMASAGEPFSMAMLEALAAGVPVLAADSGGACDLIRKGVNGTLYPTGAAEELARVLCDWLAHPPKWSAEQIRHTTMTQEQVAAQWAEVYATL